MLMVKWGTLQHLGTRRRRNRFNGFTTILLSIFSMPAINPVTVAIESIVCHFWF